MSLSLFFAWSDSAPSVVLFSAWSDSAPSSVAEKELGGVRGVTSGVTCFEPIVGNDGLASEGNVGVLDFGTTKVEVKEGSMRFDSGDFVGLAVGVLVGLVPGTIGGQVFLQIE